MWNRVKRICIVKVHKFKTEKAIKKINKELSNESTTISKKIPDLKTMIETIETILFAIIGILIIGMILYSWFSFLIEAYNLTGDIILIGAIILSICVLLFIICLIMEDIFKE
jgi:hypothetical protein